MDHSLSIMEKFATARPLDPLVFGVIAAYYI